MSAATLAVAALIALMAIGAAAVLLRDRARGRSSCGCNCGSCKRCSSPNVTVDEGCENCRGNR